MTSGFGKTYDVTPLAPKNDKTENFLQDQKIQMTKEKVQEFVVAKTAKYY